MGTPLRSPSRSQCRFKPPAYRAAAEIPSFPAGVAFKVHRNDELKIPDLQLSGGAFAEGRAAVVLVSESPELIPLLIGTPEQFSASAHRVANAEAWHLTIQQAEYWCVLHPLNSRIQEFGFPLDPAAKSDLALRCKQAFAASASVAHRGAELCAHLERSGVPAVLFKGLAAIIHLYAGPQERTVKDADILIREQDLKAAVSLLENLNLRPGHGGDLDAYVNAIRNMPGFAGNESLAVDAPPFEHLDVHWRLGRRPIEEMQVERIISRAVRGSLLGTDLLVISPADGLVLSAHHALRNRFAPSGMIRDVLDARRWLDLLKRRGELDDALAHVERCHLAPAVFALAVIAGKEPAVQRLASGEGRELAGLFHLQARYGPVGQDFAHVADSLALRQVVRAALGNWPQYRRYLSDFEKRADGKPLSLRERMKLLLQRLRSLGASRPQAFRALRTLAKVKAAYQDSTGS